MRSAPLGARSHHWWHHLHPFLPLVHVPLEALANTPAHDKPVDESRLERGCLRAVSERLLLDRAFGAIRRRRVHSASEGRGGLGSCEEYVTKELARRLLVLAGRDSVFVLFCSAEESEPLYCCCCDSILQSYLGLVYQRAKMEGLNRGTDV